ncbi:MAG: type VI secretion system membrane subunit TssM [Pyrinomonadaceae bacterium]
MSWQTAQLKNALGLGGLVSFYGLVSIIVFVGGRQFGLRLSYQIVIIAVILLTLPFALVIGYFATRTKKVEKAKAEEPIEAKAADDGQPQPTKISSPNGKYAELNQNADTAIQFLKTSNLAGTKGSEAVYSLPFFVFAGAPKSGKTSLVLSSGLNFQTLPNQRQSEQTQVRPTRDIDWRVASDAVILDTAGRYQTETEPDADEWSALLETLKKNRSIRPIDGFVLVANAEKLLAASEAEIEQQAKILRNRLDEALTRAKVRFPVYLIFTHSDAIEGFRDSFSASQEEGKNAILGATFPLEKAATAHTLFDAEFDALQQSLMKRRLVRLSAPFPPLRQLRIFNFPSHFNSSRRKLGHFVATLFRPNPFSESPLFRGFYFTASLPQVLQQRGATAENAPLVQSVGTTYFSERFFRDILLRDKDLVATFQAQKKRPPILGWLMLVFGAGLLAILLGLSVVSLLANRSLLAESIEHGKRVLEITQADKGLNPLSKSANAAREEVEAVNDLRETLAKIDKYERDGAPIWMRFGLYSGGRVFHERLLPIYFASVEQRYKKPVVKNIEDDLQKFAANQAVLNSANLSDDQEKELGKNYDLLKAYLMLSGEYKNKAEPIFLGSQLEDYWKKSSPGELESLSQQQLAFYAGQVDREEFPSIQLNKNLVDAVRKRLTAYPPIFRYYKRVTTEIDQKIDPVSVESVLAGQSAGVLEGTAKVPGSFTIEAYRGEMQKAILLAPTELSKDDWVMGEQAMSVLGTNDDIRKLQSRYFQEYTDAWRKFVRSVNVSKVTSKEDAVNSLKSFSATQSPMEILLKEVARNTNFSAKPKSKDWWGWILSYFQTATKTQTDGNSEVEKEFKPLFVFMGDEDKPDAAPVSQYRADLRRLVEPIEGASPDKIKQISKDLAADKDTIGLRKAESNIGSKTEAFKTSATQEVAELLKKPLQNLREFFGADAQSQLEKTWKEQILPKAQEIEKGYPFSPDAGEADLQKLTAYLNSANGTLSKFYNDRLEKYFEESNGAFKVKETAEVKFSPEFVAYLNNAFKLRQALFGTGATANFEYEFKLAPVKDAAVVEVSIDNQKTDSTSTGSAKFTFPGKSGGETGAFLQFTGTAEPVSAPTPNPAANTSANQSAANVNSAANTKKLPTSANSASNASNTSLPFQGQWGLFKMVDAGSPTKNQAGEYVLTYTLGVKKIIATVKPTGGDLFDKTIFRQLHAPEKMLKP